MENAKYEITFPFPSLLFIVFLTLKLCEVIDWSWWWVTAPLWVPAALVGAVAAALGLAALLGFTGIYISDKLRNKNKL